MTRRLPHIGLGGEQRSLYGENSTIGEQGKREREELLDRLAEALSISEIVRDVEVGAPIRVQAHVGDAIPELTSDA